MTDPKNGDLNMFDADRMWLEKQPGMNPWQQGCARLRGQLEVWLEEYAAPLCEKMPTEVGAAVYYERLWRCWGHHWREAAPLQPTGTIHGFEVAQRLRAHKGYQGGGRLGGNPLRDVVLAEAVLRQEPKALATLEQEYRVWAVAQACKVNRSVAEDPSDFWCLLLDRLIGYTNPPGKLAAFHGRCGLRNWIATVARRLAMPKVPRPIPEPLAPDPAEPCLRLLTLFIRPALLELPPDDRSLLFMLLFENLQGRQIGAILNIHAGNITRRKQKIVNALREKLREEVAQEAEYRRCLTLLFQERNLQAFLTLFFAVLSDLGQDAQHDSKDASERKPDHE